MNQKRPKRFSLRTRVALGVALPIFIVLAFLSLFNYRREFSLLNEQARLDAVQLGDMMIHSLNHAMLTKEEEHLISSIGDVSQLENVQLIQVVGISGKVLADSSGQMPTLVFELSDSECQSCHQYSAGERPRVIPIEQPSKGWRISAPINNLPQCHDCHNPGLDHLGVLLMDISLTSKQTHLLQDLRVNLLISVVSTALVSLMSYLLINRLVVRRVESLQKQLAEYAHGDFDNRILFSTEINDELLELADTFNQMADELERHAREEEQRHRLRERAIVDERERIARELHDGFAQVLGYVNTKVMAVRLLVKDNKLQEADLQLEHLENAARGLFVDVREAILGLKMASRTQSGLCEALEEYITEFNRLSGIPTSFSAAEDIDYRILSAETELQLFRIAQEALNNIRKHSHARHAWVNITRNRGEMVLEIRDDGIGFDYGLFEANGRDRLGLCNMEERAEEVDAQFMVRSKSGNGEGTSVVVKLPIRELEEKS